MATVNLLYGRKHQRGVNWITAVARNPVLFDGLVHSLTDPDLQALCEDLAREEQKHHDTLRTMRVSVDMEIEDRPAL